ncbi:MAG: hypothetical protein V2J25_11400 [Desulfatiglans sp.]|jgi:DNA-binding NtrC family response regulator|nr:hypothetical protein [Thermodesulfobacteriota bacterium]MEE4353463.1 hypothetical protein [Desulfatiglans sp.]
MKEKEETVDALILEEDPSVVEWVKEALETRSYTVSTLSEKEEAWGFLRRKHCPLAIVGRSAGAESEIGLLKELVKASPMTSVILLSDLTEQEVHEKTEGYGILGHISRKDALKDLFLFVDQFEEIARIIPRPRKE